MNIILLIGALLGFSSVLMGAYADHALKLSLDTKSFGMIITAIKYQQLYTVIVTCVGILLFATNNKNLAKRLSISAWSFIFGIIFFSGGIYLSIMTGIKSFTVLTPIGGCLLMLAWLLLAWCALVKVKG